VTECRADEEGKECQCGSRSYDPMLFLRVRRVDDTGEGGYDVKICRSS
jgi:hypothetical protein